jgi:hypothetical protein
VELADQEPFGWYLELQGELVSLQWKMMLEGVFFVSISM